MMEDKPKYGYAHYTGNPETPGVHDLALVPQTIADGWQAFCSCGQWQAFENFYEHPNRDSLVAKLRERFAAHVAEQGD